MVELSCCIIKFEIGKALKGMKNGKASGNDNISKRMIEACEELRAYKVDATANKIPNTGITPRQMKGLVFL